MNKDLSQKLDWFNRSRSGFKPAGFLQMLDGVAHHSITEISLRHAQQFRSIPFAMNRLDVARARDGIEFAGDEKNATSVAQGHVMRGRAEMKMPRNESAVDVRPSQLARHRYAAGILPDRMFDIHNGRH